MKKNLLAAAGMLLTLSMALPGLASSSDSLVGDWADQDSAQNLLSEAVYDGAPVSNSDQIAKATYGIYMTGNTPARCSGTLIDKKIMLTAAHCMVDAGVTSASQVFVEYYSAKTKTFKKISVLQEKPHPLYVKGSFGENDVALLLLADEIPGSIPVLLPKADVKLAENQSVLVAGLGMNSTEGLFSQVKRYKQVGKDPEAQPILAILNDKKSTDAEKKEAGINFLLILARNPLLMTNATAALSHINSNDRQATQMQLVPQGGHSICEGDSGGPSFVKQADGRLVILGVHSAGNNSECKGAKLFVFTRDSLNIDTFVPLELDWIKKTLQSFKSTLAI